MFEDLILHKTPYTFICMVKRNQFMEWSFDMMLVEDSSYYPIMSSYLNSMY